MKKKYVFMVIASLIGSGLSMLFDELITEEHTAEVAEMAAKNAVKEYMKENDRQKKQGNRAQRRGH